MRAHLLLVSILSLLLCLFGRSGLAQQQQGITRELHPWGRFAPGAWKCVRVVTETFDENGKLSSTSATETTTTLLKVEKDGVTLETEVILSVAGKRMDAKPQVAKQGFQGETEGQKVEIKDLEPGEVVIAGRAVPCKIRQVKLTDSTCQTITKLYYSDNLAPFILKRESIATNLEKKQKTSETSVIVDALQMPCAVLGEIKTAAHVKAIRKNAHGAIATTLAFTSPEVPGGIIRHQSKEEDNSGRIVRRSVLTLTDYGLEPPERRTGLLRRLRRLRKSPRAVQE